MYVVCLQEIKYRSPDTCILIKVMDDVVAYQEIQVFNTTLP